MDHSHEEGHDKQTRHHIRDVTPVQFPPLAGIFHRNLRFKRGYEGDVAMKCAQLSYAYYGGFKHGNVAKLLRCWPPS